MRLASGRSARQGLSPRTRWPSRRDPCALARGWAQASLAEREHGGMLFVVGMKLFRVRRVRVCSISFAYGKRSSALHIIAGIIAMSDMKLGITQETNAGEMSEAHTVRRRSSEMWICNRMHRLSGQSIANPTRRGECAATPLDPSGQVAVPATRTQP